MYQDIVQCTLYVSTHFILADTPGRKSVPHIPNLQKRKLRPKDTASSYPASRWQSWKCSTNQYTGLLVGLREGPVLSKEPATREWEWEWEGWEGPGAYSWPL